MGTVLLREAGVLGGHMESKQRVWREICTRQQARDRRIPHMAPAKLKVTAYVLDAVGVHLIKCQRWFGSCGFSALMLIFVVDRLFARCSPSLPVAALMDESAHAATAVIFLGPLRGQVSRRFASGALVGSVFIDVDHLPLTFGSDILTRGTNRPYSHSLLTIIVLLLVALGLDRKRRAFAFGTAFGLATHFIRDLASTSAGVSLFWPLTTRSLHLSYHIYAMTLLLSFGSALWCVRNHDAADSLGEGRVTG